MIDLLRRFLTLGIEGEGDVSAAPEVAATDQAEAGAEAGADTGDDTLDDLIESVEPARETRPTDDTESLRRRADAAERALADERAARAPLARPTSDAEYDREEAQLAQARTNGASQSDISWLQWQIDSNRKMRASDRRSQDALAQARELADKADFDRLEITKPKVYKAYAQRIEKTIADLRAKGDTVPPRAVLLRVFLGDDIMNGKIKPKVAAPARETPAAQVPRGRTPGVRSDMSGRSGSSEREKRRARLDGQII